jgi:hypothetical protein
LEVYILRDYLSDELRWRGESQVACRRWTVTGGGGEESHERRCWRERNHKREETK